MSTVHGVGLDVGTMNIVSARRAKKGTATKRIRDAFLDLPKSSKKMLKLSNVSFVSKGDSILVLGDEALEIANVFGKEARRPLHAGLVSSSEIDALEVLALLVKNVLGDPAHEGEHCYFSVPANPVDDPTRNTIYHQGVFEKIVRECGFTPHAANEAMAIIFSETAKEGFSGLSFSFGSGMTNVALAVNTIEGLSFSVARGGDWIDSNAATAVGATHSRMTSLKEAGIDLLNPTSREEEALVFYYRNLITYVLGHVSAEFKKVQGTFNLSKPVPMVVSGGTSKAGGFLDFFKKVFEEEHAPRFPFEISEIRAAEDPLNAVALGMMVQAIQEYDDDEE